MQYNGERHTGQTLTRLVIGQRRNFYEIIAYFHQFIWYVLLYKYIIAHIVHLLILWAVAYSYNSTLKLHNICKLVAWFGHH